MNHGLRHGHMHLPCCCRLGTETPPHPRPSMALSSRSPSEVDADDVELSVGFNPFRPAAAAHRVHLGPNPFQDAALQALGGSDGAAAPKAGAPQGIRRQHTLSSAAGGRPAADGLLPELRIPQLGRQASAGDPWHPAKRQSLSFKLAGGGPEAARRPRAEPGPAQSGSLLPSSLPAQSTMKQSLSFKLGTGTPGPDAHSGEAAGRPAAELGGAEQGPKLLAAGLRWRQSLSKLGAGSPEVDRPPPEVAGAAELGPLLSTGGPRRSAMKGARWKAAAELAGESSMLLPLQCQLCACTSSVRIRGLDAASGLAQCSMSAQGRNELQLPSLLPLDMSQPRCTAHRHSLHNQVTLALLCRA